MRTMFIPWKNNMTNFILILMNLTLIIVCLNAAYHTENLSAFFLNIFCSLLNVGSIIIAYYSSNDLMKFF